MKDTILFVTDTSPFGYNYSGLSSYKTSHLEALLKAYPDANLIIVVATMWQHMLFDKKAIAPLLEQYKNITDVIVCNGKLDRQLKIFECFSLKQVARYHYRNFSSDLSCVKELIQKYQPVAIWAEHLYPAILCSFASKHFYYSHHDFLNKIYVLRNNSLRMRIKSYLLSRLELFVLKCSKGVISGSELEIKEIQNYAPGVQTLFLPTTYKVKDCLSLKYAEGIEIVHLGSTSATSNKIGLINFLKEAVPVLNRAGLKYTFYVIGTVDTVYAEYKELFHQENVKLLGFVDDLDSVLKAYQIHIIPYNAVSGTRTRLTQALNYKQLLLSTYNGSSGFDKLVSFDNCILVNNLQEMVNIILKLKDDLSLLRKIADNGKQMFEQEYSLDSQADKIRSFTTFAINSNM